jgi:hypothetical protein
VLRREDLRQDVELEVLERFRIAEELGHADEQVLAELLGFLRVVREQLDVGVQRRGLPQLHATAGTAQHRAALVVAEVMARGALEDLVEPLQPGHELVVRGRRGGR